MNKRKLERQYQRVLKQNEALKGALFNCAIQIQTMLTRVGDELPIGQQCWFNDFIGYAERVNKTKLPQILCVSIDMGTGDYSALVPYVFNKTQFST